jgi:hypothetical protein
MEAREVVRVEYDDKPAASIHERVIIDTPTFTSFWNRWDPGMMSLEHGHRGDHVVFVLDGEVTVGDRVCPKGTHIFLMYGDTFGPWIAGPEGCELLGVIAGEGSAFWNAKHIADYEALLAASGGRPGATPPYPDPPAWRSAGYVLPGPTKE